MEAHGQCSEPQNILKTEDIRALYNSHGLSKAHSLGSLTGTIFDITLVTMWRLGILYNLEVSQMKLLKENGEESFAHGGLRAVNGKPLSITVWLTTPLEDNLCIFDDIMEYMEMTSDIHQVKCFLSANNFRKLEEDKVSKQDASKRRVN